MALRSLSRTIVLNLWVPIPLWVELPFHRDNPTANLNAACIALTQKDTKAAAGFLEKAPPVPETALAKGVLYFLQANYEEAEKLFRQAKDAGLSQVEDNLKQVLELK